MEAPPKYCCKRQLYYPTLLAVSVPRALNAEQSESKTEESRQQRLSLTVFCQKVPGKVILQSPALTPMPLGSIPLSCT